MDPGTKIETRYPLDPAELATFYANHINIQYLPEEVYLDLCAIQPQSADQKDIRESGLLAKVPATALARIVLSREHARRLADVLHQALVGPLASKQK